jgi:uncharacterized delta-60 repeat protein
MGRVEALERRRLLSAGDLDPTFGGGDGVVNINSPTESSEQIHFIGRQGDHGKLIIGGSAGDQFALWRLNTDGSTDTSFGTGGRMLVTVPELFANGSETFAVDPASGRIAVANSVGSFDDSNALQVRMFNANGQPDTSFGGGDGILDLNFANKGSWVGFQLDGKLILAGHNVNDFGNMSTTLTRLGGDGSADMTFGDGGDGSTLINGAQEIEIAPDDRILLGMTKFRNESGQHTDAYLPARYDIDLARLTADGVIDNSFSDDGFIHVADDEGEFGLPQAIASDIIVDADGDVHLLWVLRGVGAALSQSFLNSYSADGDFSDGFSGMLPFPLAPYPAGDFISGDFGFDPQGRMVVTGAIGQSTDSGRFAARFLPDGTLDQTYGERGTFQMPPEYIEPGTLRGLVLPDGGALLAMSLGNVPEHSIFIQQLAGGVGDVADITLNRRGTLIVHTNDSAENVQLYLRGRDGRLIVRVGDDFARSFAPSRVKKIALYLHGGGDTLTIGAGVRGTYCDGGDGNDVLSGGQGNDMLFGAAGKDRLFGYDGNDILMGGGGSDYLLGGAGKDDLFGNAGFDTLSGAGGNDRLFGNADADKIFGGAGTDLAADSEDDEFVDIETLLGS